MDVFGSFSQPGTANPLFSILILLISVWTIFWKGLALWNCAHNNQKNWFIALMVLNTVGILDIVYLFRFSQKRYTLGTILELVKHPKI